MRTLKELRLLIVVWSVCSALGFSGSEPNAPKMPHIVFVIGDHEYGSESTLPALAQELKQR